MPTFATVDLRRYINHSRATPAGWDAELGPLLQALPSGAATFWGVPFELAAWSADAPAWALVGERPLQTVAGEPAESGVCTPDGCR